MSTILPTVIPTSYYLVVAAVIFMIGALGVLIRRDPLIMFMCIELMLNSVNVTLVAFARHLRSMEGQIFVFFVMTVAAAEVVIGLAIIVAIFRTRETIDVDVLSSMRG